MATRKKKTKTPLSKIEITDEQIITLSHLACHVFIFRILDQFTLLLESLNLNLIGDRGPFLQGSASHARFAEEIITTIQKLYDAKMAFRNGLQSTLRSPHLVHFPKFLTQTKNRIIAPLKVAHTNEEDARKAIKQVAKYTRTFTTRVSEQQKLVKGKLNDCLHRLSAPAREGGALSIPLLTTKELTVVSVDMSEYGRLSTLISQLASVDALFNFNDDIQDTFKRAIESVGGNPQEIPTMNTGDGALLFFSDPNKAFAFAKKVQSDAKFHNNGVTESAQKRYRIGMAIGEVRIRETRSADGKVLSFSTAGIAIAHSVRIQSQCDLGAVALSDPCFISLGKKLHDCHHFTNATCKGKPHENLELLVRIWKP